MCAWMILGENGGLLIDRPLKVLIARIKTGRARGGGEMSSKGGGRFINVIRAAIIHASINPQLTPAAASYRSITVL